MPNYHFRFRFLLPHDRVLGSEEQSLELYSSTEHGHYVLEAVSGTSLEESQWALIKDAGEGFATAGEAAEAGRHVKNAVMWWSVTQRVGVDVGTDSTSVVVTQTAIDQFRNKVLGCSTRYTGCKCIGKILSFPQNSFDPPSERTCLKASRISGKISVKYLTWTQSSQRGSPWHSSSMGFPTSRRRNVRAS